jgi:hypothetical protein
MNSPRTVALSVASVFLILSCTESNAPPAASQLAFTAQPTNATVAVTLAPAVQVTARDAQGSIVSSFTGNVTVALAANPGNATLSGTLTVAAVAGVASFSNLSVNKGEEGYTLAATSGTLTAATSVAFDVAEVVSTYALRYYYDLNLETGVITNCQPMPNFCMAIDDFYLAYNSTRAVPAVVFQNRQAAGGRRIAHLAGRAFSGVHLADTTGAGFVATLIDQPFDNTRTILVRTDAGNIYKLGNPVGFGTQQADSVRFQAARLN